MRLIFAVVIFVSSSCSKSAETVVDCIAESLLVSMQHEAAPTNSKEIHFNITYSGSFSFSSVTWDFGDGKSETVNVTSTIHTYTQPGTYSVKAKVNLKKGNGTCAPEPVKSVTVN